MAKGQVPSGALFSSVPLRLGQSIEACFIFWSHFGVRGRIWKYLCNLPSLCDASAELMLVTPVALEVTVNQRLFLSSDVPIEICKKWRVPVHSVSLQ